MKVKRRDKNKVSEIKIGKVGRTQGKEKVDKQMGEEKTVIIKRM